MNEVEQNGVENNDDNDNENRRENLAKIEEELIELTSKIINPGILLYKVLSFYGCPLRFCLLLNQRSSLLGRFKAIFSQV